ncbi:LacI family DNA-binding transcriptional regulator [Alsobacter sp. R-9]
MTRKPRTVPATIADVAALAGVSTATVSRALAKPDSVRPETVALVMKAVKASGYTPNSSARNLRRQRTNMVLVVVPSIANQMYSHVLRGIDTGLAPAGYGVIIGNLDNAPDKEAGFVELAFSRQVDGIILLCGYVPRARGRSLADAGLPMVSLLSPIGDSAIPDISVDDRAAGREAGRLIARLGHRRVAYAAGPKGHSVDTLRWTGMREAAVEGGIDAADILRLEGPPGGRYTFAAGLGAAEAFLALSDRPTAVFCASDEIAIGFLKSVRRAGLRVPQDVSIIGFDGNDLSDFTEPVLSTIRQPRHDLGRTGAEVLLGMIDGSFDPSRRVIHLPVEVLQRESTAPPSRRATVVSIGPEERAKGR